MKNKRHIYTIIFMFVVAIVLITMALPQQKDKMSNLTYELGKPWPNPMLTAPFEIPIEHDDQEKARITDSINANFVKIYRRDHKLGDSQVAKLKKALDAYSDVPGKQQLLYDVSAAYEAGIVDNKTSDEILKGELPKIRILNDKSVAELVHTDRLRSARQVYERLDTIYGGSIVDILSLVNVNDYLVPNVTIDDTENKKLLDDALASALAPIGSVQTGEAIIYTGNIVTPQKYTIIKTMEAKLAEKSQENNLNANYILLGRIMLITIILAMYCYFLIFMRYRVFASMRSMVFLVTFMTLFIIAVFLLVSFKPNFFYMIPFAIVPVIIMTFFDSKISFFTHIVVVLVCSLAAAEQALFIIMQFLAGCIAIASMQELTRRSQLVRCAFFIFIAYSLSYISVVLGKGMDLSSLDWHYFMYFGISCVVLSFAYVAIFIVEKLFGFTSLVTLVELSDINTPLMRKLSENCPGTFQHVLQVANLASEAALKVGASQQLVRAGALYHDIGKIVNPAFFTENQTGVNPHDSLDPDQSALIVISHVTDGLRMADKARLPQVVKDLILQHHGTSTARYFYYQACQANGGEPVDPAPYTYPGPKPQTKEAAILMMADACEAAARSLNDYSEKSIAGLVEKIIDGQIAAGQLKEAPISFNQVETVKRTFVERLKIFYHRRISYPDDIKPKKS